MLHNLFVTQLVLCLSCFNRSGNAKLTGNNIARRKMSVHVWNGVSKEQRIRMNAAQRWSCCYALRECITFSE